MSGEKKKPPTPHSLKKAREDEGETGASQDATAAVAILGVLFALTAGAAWLVEQLRMLLASTVQFITTPREELPGQVYSMMLNGMLLIVPLALVGTLAGIAGVAVQGGITMAFKKVEMKLELADPISGFGRIFSMRTLMEGIKTLVKLILMTAYLWFVVQAMFPLIVGTAARPPLMIASVLWELLLKLMYSATLFIGLAALIDYKLQRWLFLRDKRMSEEDVKRERKEQNGNPEIKQKQKEIAREAAEEAPAGMAALPNVVVANPTHYSVALAYTPGSGVPVIVAKGEDERAFALRSWAERAFIPVIEQPALARRLYLVGVGEAIPAETYQAVATILRWIESIGRKQPDSAAAKALP